MTTSASVDYDQSAIEIIKDALILIGGLEDDETPTASQAQYALRMLNRMVKAWSVKGLKAWQWRDDVLGLIQGQSQYDLGPTGDLDINRPLQISNVRRVVDDCEVEIPIKSRQEYMSMPDKATLGKPIFVYFDAQLESAKLFVWPTPDANDLLYLSYKSYLEDIDSLANTTSFPAEWLEAIVYNLALRLMPMYDVSGEDKTWITNMAIQYLAEAELSDTDQGSVFLQPERVY